MAAAPVSGGMAGPLGQSLAMLDPLLMLRTAPHNTLRVQRKCASCENYEQSRALAGAGAPPKKPPCKQCDEESVQRKASEVSSGKPADHSGTESAIPESVPHTLSGGGAPLESPTRVLFENLFQRDFSSVRIHTGGAAAQSTLDLRANAYTVGSHIAFAPGRFEPHGTEGRKLLAHELTHVVQQSRGTAGPKAGVSTPSDPSEHEADQVAERVALGKDAGAVLSMPATVQRDTPPGQDQPPATTPPAGDGTAPPADAKKSPQPTGETIVFQGITLSESREQLRFEMERLITKRGMGAHRAFAAEIQLSLLDVGPLRCDRRSGECFGGQNSPEDHARKEKLRDKILPNLNAVNGELDKEEQKVLAEFETRANGYLTAMLAASEAKVLDEQKRYGLKTTTTETRVNYGDDKPRYHTFRDTTYSMDKNGATEGLAAAAKGLADKLREIADINQKRFGLIDWGERMRPMTGEEITQQKKDMAEFERLGEELKKRERAYKLLRFEEEGRFPILGSYAGLSLYDAIAALDKVAAGPNSPQMAETLNKDVTEKLDNIRKVRAGMESKEVSIWKLPVIVAGTKAKMGLGAESLWSKVIDDKAKNVATSEVLQKLALAVVAIGLGLLAAIPTGGGSLAVGVSVAAGVGSAALGVGMAVSDLREFQLQSAAAGTDFDKAQAVSSEDPSLFWLALSILGAGLDVGGAVAAFRTLASAARAAKSAQRAAKSTKAAAELEQAEKAVSKLSEQADGIRPGLGKRVTAEMQEAATEEAARAEGVFRRWTEEGVNAETKTFLETNPGVKAVYHDMDPQMRALFTHCASNCVIPNISRSDVARVRNVLDRYNPEDLAGLKEFFHFRRNNLGEAIAELEQAKNVDELKALFGATLKNAPEQAEAEAMRTLKNLQDAGVTPDVSVEKFIERYKEGLRYDEGTKTWFNPVMGLGEKARFPTTASTQDVFNTLTGTKGTGFEPYRQVLVAEGIAKGDDEFLKALEGLKPQGRTIDAVRHEMKELYRSKLLAKMTTPDEAAMRLRYPDLDWAKNSQDALRQASHQEMLRLTQGLPPSDRGNIAEAWYKTTYAPSAAEHVRIPSDEIAKLGSTHGADRIPDLVEGNTLRDLKTISGKMGKHDLEQFDDFMKIGHKPGGFPVTAGGNTTNIQRVVYTMTVPDGVRANASWMVKQLNDYPNLAFEIFNNAGSRKMVTKANAHELAEPALSKWLSATK